ncbi:hypothetical protein [Helicobacter felis]|uniref:Chaperone ClpB n=1 Tax=Helicobacter felis (strain ATCC 49179 / CCUG 28539 / NCTC 12436 / CS1) TaxID=936155 RepID=E7AC34_HELFC|nr:hypothetical protein [Helicobacter felis]CBY82116.1 chaperone ClpB [Helicobacter felis ATCC 49179]
MNYGLVMELQMIKVIFLEEQAKNAKRISQLDKAIRLCVSQEDAKGAKATRMEQAEYLKWDNLCNRMLMILNRKIRRLGEKDNG